MKIIDIDQTLLRLRELADSGVLTLEQAEFVRDGIKVIEHLRKMTGPVSVGGEDLAAMKARIHPGRSG